MARRRRQQEAPAGAPEWLVTFSDLMSLLLTFFVLLLSFSTVSQKDFDEAMSSVQGALGVLDLNMGVMTPLPLVQSRKEEQSERAARRLRRQLQVLGLERQVKVEFDASGGLKISLPGEILFEAGSAEVLPAALPLLRDVAEVLKELPDSFIEVRGHTDTSPLTITETYRDNYDLSYHRAHSVFEQLSAPSRVPVEQFEITAAGASQPQAPNDTLEGRRANRRVEIYVRGFIDQQKVESLQGADPEAALPAAEAAGRPVEEQLEAL